MIRILIKCAILLGGLYATGLALWRLCATAAFVWAAVCVPGEVVDVKERPFESITEQLQHGNLPWEGDIAYQPFVRYEVQGRPTLDDSLPDRDNRNYTNGQQVEIILHPENPDSRHINSAKFLWGGDLTLLMLGVALLLIARRLWRRRRAAEAKAAPRRARTPEPQPAPPAPAPREEAPAARSASAPAHREPPAPRTAEPAPAPRTTADELVLSAEPAPRKRRKKAADGSTPAKSRAKSTGAKKTTTRTRKSATDSATAADKPKSPRRRKKSAEADQG